MAQMQTVKCRRCKEPFEARTADIKRGWGKFCSKSCKAKQQEALTGQHAAHSFKQQARYYATEYGGRPSFDRNGDYIGFTGIDHDHDCNKDL